MGDPLLISLDDRTGEGVLQLDDGSREFVHLPSVPGLIYADARETGAPPGARVVQQSDPTVIHGSSRSDDGIMGSADPVGAPAPVRRPTSPGELAVPLVPPQRHALYAAEPPIETPPLADEHGEPLELPSSGPARIPADVPASWLAPEAGVPMPPSAEEAARREALRRVASVEPVGTAQQFRLGGGVPTMAPVAPVTVPEGMRGPTPEEIARGRAAPPAPVASAPAPRVRTSPSPRTPVLSPQTVRYLTQPEAFEETIAGITGTPEAFEETIAGITGTPEATRGSPGNPFDLVDRQTQIAQRQARLAADDARRQQGVVAAAEDERRSLETERQGAMQNAQQRYQNAIDRVANARIDPNGWFRDQGAFGVVGATIAVALGALGSAMTGSSTNAALDGINAAIDRDLNAQQSEIEAGQAAADLSANMLAVVGDEFTDREAARLAARAAMLDQAALELQSHTADLASDEAIVIAEALRAQLAAAAAEAREAALDRQSQRDLRAAQARRADASAMRGQARAMGGGAPHAVRLTPTMISARRDLIADGMDPVRAGIEAGMTPEQAASLPQSVGDAAEQNVAALDDATSYLETLIPADPEDDVPGIGRGQQYVPEILTSDEGLEIQRAGLALAELYGRVHSGGAISEDERNAFAAILGVAPGSSGASLRRGIRMVRREIAARTRGAPRADAAPDRDLDGAGSWDE